MSTIIPWEREAERAVEIVSLKREALAKAQFAATRAWVRAAKALEKIGERNQAEAAWAEAWKWAWAWTQGPPPPTAR